MSLTICRMTLLGCGKAILGLWNYAMPKGSPTKHYKTLCEVVFHDDSLDNAPFLPN